MGAHLANRRVLVGGIDYLPCRMASRQCTYYLSTHFTLFLKRTASTPLVCQLYTYTYIYVYKCLHMHIYYIIYI